MTTLTSIALSCFCLLPIDTSELRKEFRVDLPDRTVYTPKQVLLIHTDEKINPAAFLWGVEVKRPGKMINKGGIGYGDIVAEDTGEYIVFYRTIRPDRITDEGWPNPEPQLETAIKLRYKR